MTPAQGDLATHWHFDWNRHTRWTGWRPSSCWFLACCRAAMRHVALQLTLCTDFVFHTLWALSMYVEQAQIPVKSFLNWWSDNIADQTSHEEAVKVCNTQSHISSDPKYDQLKMRPRWLYYNNEHMPSWVSLLHPTARTVCVCVWWWTVSASANAWTCACSWAAPCVCPCSHVSKQMLPEASAVSPVMCCPLTFNNIWRCGGPLVKDSPLLWLIMMLCLSLICLTSRSAIWHLHGISIYLWASRLTLQCAELVGMTPVRQRGRCHSGRSHSGCVGEDGSWGWETGGV